MDIQEAFKKLSVLYIWKFQETFTVLLLSAIVFKMTLNCDFLF